jgi:vacuolar protein sorting-associated protein 45
MNVVQAVRDYVARLAGELGPAMKTLVLDAETVGVVSVVISQKEITDRGVYLVQRLDVGDKEEMKQVSALFLVRPTRENIDLIKEELRRPRFKDYTLVFTNVLKQAWIEELAGADEHECVRSVQEYFADFYAINRDLFSLNIPSVAPLLGHKWDHVLFNRIGDGLTAALLALKRRPVIRYAASSDACKQLAREVSLRMTQENALFDWRRPDTAPLLLILDRKEDPVSPLLTQWTLQAMVHEELGLANNRVDLRGRPEVAKEYQEVPLSSEQDDFYRDNMYATFDVFVEAINKRLLAFSERKRGVQHIESVADMKRFIEQYPDFRREEAHVMKHFTLVPELSRVAERHDLMAVSELEQSIACDESHAQDAKAVAEVLGNTKVRLQHKVRLVMIYALRYEGSRSSATLQFIDTLRDLGCDARLLRAIGAVTRYGGEAERSADIFGNRNMFTKLSKKVTQGFKGVQNVYTRHEPLLRDILGQVAKGTLPAASFPFHEGGRPERPQDVIVFVFGGVTYEEAKVVAELNAQGGAGAIRVVLGGTNIHNSKSFIDFLLDLPEDRIPRRR